MNVAPPITLDQCSAIILAAGLSRRFGQDDKLAARIDGTPILQRVIDTVTALPLGQIVLVRGGSDTKGETLRIPPSVRVVHNLDLRAGMGHSIAIGAAEIAAASRAAFIVLGDMPFVTDAIYSRLANQLDGTASVARPVTPMGPGHPVLFAACHFEHLRALTGDAGAGAIVRAAGSGLALVETDDVGCYFDVDTPDALARAKTGHWKLGKPSA